MGDRAVLEHIDSLRELECLHCILLGKQHGHALRIDSAKHGENRVCDAWSKPKLRFVENEQPRLRHQRAPDGKHLLLTPRQRSRALLSPLA